MTNHIFYHCIATSLAALLPDLESVSGAWMMAPALVLA